MSTNKEEKDEETTEDPLKEATAVAEPKSQLPPPHETRPLAPIPAAAWRLEKLLLQTTHTSGSSNLSDPVVIPAAGVSNDNDAMVVVETDDEAGAPTTDATTAGRAATATIQQEDHSRPERDDNDEEAQQRRWLSYSVIVAANPAKRVRRWLSTSSGVAADATLTDVRLAAQVLFPSPSSSNEEAVDPVLALLLQREPEELEEDEKSESILDDPNKERKDPDAMQVEEQSPQASQPQYYLKTSALEVQAWLLSLKVRLLYRHTRPRTPSDDNKELADPSQLLLRLTHAAEICRTGITWLTEILHNNQSHSLGGDLGSTLSSSSSSLFPLLARLWRFYVLLVLDERFPKYAGTTTTTAIDATKNMTMMRLWLRSELAQAHNAALLRRDLDTTAVLLNCMLREMLQQSQVEQAQKLLSNSTFPSLQDSTSGGGTSSGIASSSSSSSYNNNNQLCRYLYYSGRIQALRLDYTNAYASLTQSLRKAPTNTALGFRIAVQRLLIVVQLLMGEIPERHVFYFTTTVTTSLSSSTTTSSTVVSSSSSTVAPPSSKTHGRTVTRRQQLGELEPYLHITQAVRRGDLAVFTRVVSEHQARLQADETFTLISRLAHQVVKAGLRKLQTCYSRLSLADVAQRLGLANAQQAELVVAKAIRDGVLDATIHHKEQYISSHNDLHNVVYATKEPAQAFHRRIAYCLTMHNDAVRAMRYPPDAYKQQLEASRSGSARGRRNKDDKTDEEKAQELEDELEEDY